MMLHFTEKKIEYTCRFTYERLEKIFLNAIICVGDLDFFSNNHDNNGNEKNL